MLQNKKTAAKRKQTAKKKAVPKRKKKTTSKKKQTKSTVKKQTTTASTKQPPQTESKNKELTAADAIIPGLILVILFLVFKFSRIFSGRGTQSDQHGTAGFASLNEIKRLTTSVEPGDILVGEVRDLKILTKLVNLPKDLALKHTLILGPTGAGKSRSFFLPNCYYAGNTSFIATDPKSELWEETAYNNLKPIRFAPTDPGNSAALNFVAYCKDIDYAEAVAAAIIAPTPGGNDKFWTNAELGLITAMLLHIAHSDIPTPTHLYNLITSGIESISKVLADSPHRASRALLMTFVESKKDNKSGIVQGLAGNLNWMNNDKVRRFTSSDTHAFNFGQLREKPYQIFWCLEQDDVVKLQTLSTIFFSIIITQLLKQKKGRVPINLFFDEFGNIGKIKHFENHITLLRGQGVAVSAGLQDISQLETLYDKSPAKTILNNFNNKLLLAGLQGDTAEEFSKQLGPYTYVSNTTSFSESGGFFNKNVTKTTGTKEHSRQLMTADELRRLGDNEIILLSTNLRPVRMRRLFFTRPATAGQPSFSFRCGQEIPAPEYQRIEAATTNARKKSYDDI